MPLTALPLGAWRTSFRIVVFMVVFVFVRVIDPEQCACEGGDLSEAYEEGFMDLALRVDADTAEEEREASEGEDGGGQKLYVQACFHGS